MPVSSLTHCKCKFFRLMFYSRNRQLQKDCCSVISILFSMRVGEISALEALAFEEEKAKKEYTEK